MENNINDRKNTDASSSETLRSIDSFDFDIPPFSTDSHFIEVLNDNLEEIQKGVFEKHGSNYAMSNYSDNDSDQDNGNSSIGGSDSMNNSFHLESIYQMDRKYRKLSAYQVERSIEKYYYETENRHSNELDILITYMKGQKNVYILSKNVTQYKLNCLLIPSILITAAVTIFAPFIQPFAWSGGFISGLNAITTMLISLSNYLKLESSVDMYYATANQYDKLETSLEFVSSKLLFVESESEKSRIILKNIQDVEKKINEIKQWNPLFIPSEVRAVFPNICNINIFTFIKRMELHRKNLVIRLKDVTNEIRYILYMKRERENGKYKKTVDLEKEDARLSTLNQIKEKTKDELIRCKLSFGHIDELFTREIKRAYSHSFLSFTRSNSDIGL